MLLIPGTGSQKRRRSKRREYCQYCRKKMDFVFDPRSVEIAEKLEWIIAMLDILLRAQSTPGKRFMTITSAAEYIDLSRGWIEGWIRRGELAASRVCKRQVLVDREKLDRLMLEELDNIGTPAVSCCSWRCWALATARDERKRRERDNASSIRSRRKTKKQATILSYWADAARISSVVAQQSRGNNARSPVSVMGDGDG